MPAFGESVRQLNVGGLVVAAVGFGLTRYPILDSLRPDVSPVGFLLGEATVLVAGLGLTAFGVGLALSTRESAHTRVIAQWCLLGTAGMAAVVGLAYATTGSTPASPTESRLIANVLVGGAVGGTLIGVRSASLRRHRRDLTRQTDRLTVLNRLLRHEVLNKVNVIEGYASVEDGMTDGGPTTDAWAVVRRHAAAIDETIEKVDVLTESGRSRPIDLSAHVRNAAASVREAHPAATVEVDVPSVEVSGSPHLHVLIEHLLENAVVHSDRDAPEVRLHTETDDRTVRVRIVDDGPGLPSAQQRLIGGRVTPERDDPQSGFGLAIARLVLDDADGRLTVETPVADDRGTALTITLNRNDAPDTLFGATPARLKHGTVAGLVAGATMGVVTQFATGQMGVIGALYGVGNVAVGWITHQYHSVFFALLFVAATASWVRDDDGRSFVGLGAGYGVLLWLFAAGVVMPLWLRAVGVPAPVPNLRLPSLANHLLWGSALGGVYGWFRGR